MSFSEEAHLPIEADASTEEEGSLVATQENECRDVPGGEDATAENGCEAEQVPHACSGKERAASELDDAVSSAKLAGLSGEGLLGVTRGGEVPVVFQERNSAMAAAGSLDLRKTIAGYLFRRELSDVVVKVPIRAPGSGELILYRAFRCHKFILAARSQVLARLLYDYTLVEEMSPCVTPAKESSHSASICSSENPSSAVGSLELSPSDLSLTPEAKDSKSPACAEGVKVGDQSDDAKRELEVIEEEEKKDERGREDREANEKEKKEEKEEKKEDQEETTEEKKTEDQTEEQTEEERVTPKLSSPSDSANTEDPKARETRIAQPEVVAKAKKMVSIPSCPIVGKDTLILEENCFSAVKSMLEWIYTERTSGLEEHCMEVLRIAKKYEVQELVDACHKQFMSGINEYTVCDMLVNFSAEKGSSNPEEDAVRDSIVKYLLDYAQQYAHLVLENQEFASLGEDLVTTILQQDSLNCEEEQVFNAVDRWATKHCALLGLEKTPEHKRMVGANLIGLVRFPNLDAKQIATKVRESGLLTGEQLVELFSFITLKQGTLSFCKTEPRKARDITFLSSNAVRLPCNGEFTGGVMEYIATAGGKEEYKNPMLRKEVEVRPSSWMPDADEQYYVVGKEVKRCVTLALANQSIVIELLGWKVCPTAYLLRHYSSWDTEALRSWTLHGSRDGHSWYLLSSHSKDETLNTKGQYHIWRFPEETVEFYSHFKIQQTGSNSNSHEYLACSGFELWGTLLKVADKGTGSE